MAQVFKDRQYLNFLKTGTVNWFIVMLLQINVLSMIENIPFWKKKTLREMTKDEWESLCDGCGLCCMVKLQDEDTHDVFITNVGCRYLDIKTCKCKDYENRHKNVKDCIRLTCEKVETLDWLPETCSYRLIDEGKDLFDWHYLISNDKKTVHKAGISKKGMIIPEDYIDNVEEYALDCLDQILQETE